MDGDLVIHVAMEAEQLHDFTLFWVKGFTPTNGCVDCAAKARKEPRRGKSFLDLQGLRGITGCDRCSCRLALFGRWENEVWGVFPTRPRS